MNEPNTHQIVATHYDAGSESIISATPIRAKEGQTREEAINDYILATMGRNVEIRDCHIPSLRECDLSWDANGKPLGLIQLMDVTAKACGRIKSRTGSTPLKHLVWLAYGISTWELAKILDDYRMSVSPDFHSKGLFKADGLDIEFSIRFPAGVKHRFHCFPWLGKSGKTIVLSEWEKGEGFVVENFSQLVLDVTLG